MEPSLENGGSHVDVYNELAARTHPAYNPSLSWEIRSKMNVLARHSTEPAALEDCWPSLVVSAVDCYELLVIISAELYLLDKVIVIQTADGVALIGPNVKYPVLLEKGEALLVIAFDDLPNLVNYSALKAPQGEDPVERDVAVAAKAIGEAVGMDAMPQQLRQLAT